MTTKTYIPIRRSQIRYYCRVPLYCEMPPGSFQLYKPPGMGISDLRLDEGLHPRLFIQHVDRSEAIREGVLCGLGVSILSTHAVRRELEQGLVRPLEVDKCSIERHFHLIYKKQFDLMPSHKLFLEYVRENARAANG